MTQAAEEIELEAGRTEAVALSDAGRSMAWLHSVYAQLHGAVATFAGVIVLVVGGASVARGTMSIGSLVAFYTLLALLRAQGNAVLTTIPQVISGRESLARLAAILDAPDRHPYHGSRTPSLHHSLALRNVDFGYTDGTPVLHGLSFELERGEWLTLVGPNGSGKTTVAALLLGLYRPWRGSVAADGVPYDELDLQALRRRIGFVPQRPILFPASIAENIAYGTGTVDAARVHEAAELATVDEFVDGLDHGYRTPVGDGGDLLSGGERQRIAIARALLREPAVLVLDEPTSSLDRHAMAQVLSNLRALAHEPAVLVITHDQALIDDAERVVVLGDGVAGEPTMPGSASGPGTLGAHPRSCRRRAFRRPPRGFVRPADVRAPEPRSARGVEREHPALRRDEDHAVATVGDPLVCPTFALQSRRPSLSRSAYSRPSIELVEHSAVGDRRERVVEARASCRPGLSRDARPSEGEGDSTEAGPYLPARGLSLGEHAVARDDGQREPDAVLARSPQHAARAASRASIGPSFRLTMRLSATAGWQGMALDVVATSASGRSPRRAPPAT